MKTKTKRIYNKPKRVYKGKTYHKRQNDKENQLIRWVMLIMVVALSLSTLSEATGALLSDLNRKDRQSTVSTIFRALERKNETVKDIILRVAKEREFKDTELLFCLAKYESNFNPYAVLVNVHRQSDGTVLTTYDRGLFQLNSHWQRQVKNDCAFDSSCSTNEVISILNREGNANLWVAGEFCQ